MDPTPFFIMGTMFGITATLLIQLYARRRVCIALSETAGAPARKVALLASENERQHGMIVRLEERIGVIERIATDPAERISREIEQLQLTPANRG